MAFFVILLNHHKPITHRHHKHHSITGPLTLKSFIVSNHHGFQLSSSSCRGPCSLTFDFPLSSSKLHPIFETLFLFYLLSIYLLNFLFFLWAESSFLCNFLWIWGFGWFRFNGLTNGILIWIWGFKIQDFFFGFWVCFKIGICVYYKNCSLVMCVWSTCVWFAFLSF